MHIFRKGDGHLPDTPESRKLIYDTANDRDNFVGEDIKGRKWYAKKLKDGSEVWAKVVKGSIADGGMNETSASWDPVRGMVRNPGEKDSDKRRRKK